MADEMRARRTRDRTGLDAHFPPREGDPTFDQLTGNSEITRARCAESRQELSDGELFYIIKNGIRFTGMPGWGGEDEDNWKLVLFIRHLPKLSAEEQEMMKDVNDQAE